MSSATHARRNTSLLAASEKRLLIWMAERLPRWIHSDHLSALGLAAMAGTGLAFWLTAIHPVAGAGLVALCLLLNWFGDSLDGTLARVRNRLRPRYGYYLDHVIDLTGTALVFAGLAASGPVIRPFGLVELRLFDLGGIVGVAGMVVTVVITSVRNAHALYLEETIRS